jgi:GH24 family phage-related lysozyme (muramidase)
VRNIDQFLADLIRWEGLPTDGGGAFAYPYLDSKGLVTAGVGEHLSVAEFARAGGWAIGDRFATPEELGAAYAALLAVGQNAVYPFGASHYAQFTSIRLPVAVARQRCEDRLVGEFLPHLHREASDLFLLPLPVQRVMVDLCYNLGVGEFTAAKWPHLFSAVAAGDYSKASEQCTTGPNFVTSRNNWRVLTMLGAAEVTS